VAGAPEACPVCGSRAEPAQEYCLDCGSRIVPARRLSSIGRAWERRLGRYPGDWIWASLLLLLVAAGSATAGIVAGGETSTGGNSDTIVALSPVVRAPPASSAATPQRAPKTKSSPAPAPPASSRKPNQGLTAWPARNGFTVVLASIPARGDGGTDARAKARAARGAGVRDVGILVSSRFASLHPGYYVIFAGVYGSLDEAQTAANRLSGRYPNAYARQITR
jgi:hypothetical protein